MVVKNNSGVRVCKKVLIELLKDGDSYEKSGNF